MMSSFQFKHPSYLREKANYTIYQHRNYFVRTDDPFKEMDFI